jgi:hypothetical protein
MYIYTRVYNDMGMRGRLWDYGSVSLSDADARLDDEDARLRVGGGVVWPGVTLGERDFFIIL